MLETMREFAGRGLAEAGEVDLVRTRHRDHYLRLAEAATALIPGTVEDRWWVRLTREMDNMRAALAWSRDQDDAESLARMVTPLLSAARPGRIGELLMWLEAAADRADDLSPLVRARVRILQCYIPILVPGSGTLGQVPALASEALDLARASGGKQEEAVALLILGLIARLASGAKAMRPYLLERLPLARSVGFAVLGPIEATARSVFAIFRFFQSHPEEPRPLSEEAVTIAKGSADLHTQLFPL